MLLLFVSIGGKGVDYVLGGHRDEMLKRRRCWRVVHS